MYAPCIHQYVGLYCAYVGQHIQVRCVFISRSSAVVKRVFQPSGVWFVRVYYVVLDRWFLLDSLQHLLALCQFFLLFPAPMKALVRAVIVPVVAQYCDWQRGSECMCELWVAYVPAEIIARLEGGVAMMTHRCRVVSGVCGRCSGVYMVYVAPLSSALTSYTHYTTSHSCKCSILLPDHHSANWPAF